MENPLKTLQIDRWYKALLAISTAVLLLSLGVPMQGVENKPIQLLSLGGVLFGMGEWRNHPLSTKIGPNIKITSYPRRFTFVGTVLALPGVGLIIWGAALLLKRSV